jgi:LCP family protein required for cell wall assembly
MKKNVTLILLFVLVATFLAGCSLGGIPNADLEVTPALTPLYSTDTGSASSGSQSGADSIAASARPAVVIAGADSAAAQRTPIAIQVPLTPVPMVLASAQTDGGTASQPAAAQPQTTPIPESSQESGQSADAGEQATPVFAETPQSAAAESDGAAADDEETGYKGVPVSLDDTLNILVVGSDERKPGQPWRSDVIMVIAVDYANRQVGVISFPRDMWVDIPTVGKNRINTATFFGGINNYPNGGDIGLLKDTLAQNFGIRIDHYMKFNFETFKDVIDALDGVDITVDCPITGRFPVEPGSKELKWQTLEPGEYHMDGEFALRYARERKTTSDVDRNRRQQRILIAMRKRAREVNIIPRIPALYDAMKENIETDLGLTDIIALTRLGLQIATKDVHGFNIGYKELDSWTTPGGASVLKPDMNKIQEGINELFSKPSILKNPSKPRNCQ